MRALLVTFALIVGLATAANAQDTEIQDVIGSQIEAFQADDFATAFTFASPSIQHIFRTPDVFGKMVTQGYPMVWRPSEVQFLDLQDQDGALWQRVLITDQDGVAHVLAYRMQATQNGWKISGVQLLDQGAVSA